MGWFNKIQRMTVVLLCICVNAHAAQKVHIYLDDQLDFELFSNPQSKPVNIAGATNRLVFTNLGPDTKVVFAKASLNRTIKLMENADYPACTVNKISTTHRKSKFLFSLPVNFYWSHKLYTYNNNIPNMGAALNHKGEIKSLPELFKAFRNKVIVIADNFSYGDFLDQQLKEVDRHNLVVRGGSDHYETVHRMFILGRVDFLLSYPAEFHRYSNNEELPVKSYHIAGAPKVVIGHIMCNNNVQSKKFIARVNEVLMNLYLGQEFVEAHTDFLPASEHNALAAYIKSYYHKTVIKSDS
ncbi:hypothetical protein [Pseudoalteromonas luteoviolacea]|uniref:Solute-binding protein family 3/N-terminal domain-containing protein n=1 Tax=Pseudoalteromonas luteoviolacea DSM 6061 TaxID=1365250 RepID=A0A166WAB7_9GAMM|nr:hypothetical protein [Pseudoalteromonas luteoviolacea]KZN36667.1 hypothetical protein N475_17225 [Pseudoalteromonas luteoviolacea DSM 6061]KZN51851.1 hypothetical protein N474_23665 [Pseudoalteromonas luteoviolacea CPMOR-2]MBE0390108.1 hypothetical protein [Pseudoalteromonas luteoviolacea DSM 6061]TQF67357.1 hypothetical protein FLM44_19405 [Pseudoalteromonas luteoviolacea]